MQNCKVFIYSKAMTHYLILLRGKFYISFYFFYEKFYCVTPDDFNGT